jgi:hypothetical protein
VFVRIADPLTVCSQIHHFIRLASQRGYYMLRSLEEGLSSETFIMELLIFATFNMDTKRYQGWKNRLEGNEGIDNIADLIDHFAFNKEDWRSHIPMFTP